MLQEATAGLLWGAAAVVRGGLRATAVVPAVSPDGHGSPELLRMRLGRPRINTTSPVRGDRLEPMSSMLWEVGAENRCHTAELVWNVQRAQFKGACVETSILFPNGGTQRI